MIDFMWVEKYAPETIQDCILPPNVKGIMEGVVNTGDIQNYIFHSSPGTGKTTCAVALCKQLNAEFIVVNGSDEGRFLDTARDRVKTHASSISMFNPDAPKVVIYDEFDNTLKDVQMLLRGIINDFQDTCRFIFTGNYLSKILEPIQSRCCTVDFSITDQKTKAEMGKAFHARVMDILKMEGVPVEDPRIIAQFIMKRFPDFRKTLNELQGYAQIGGGINNGILTMTTNSYEPLLQALQKRSYKEARQWLVDNNVGGEFYSEFASYITKTIKTPVALSLVMLLGDEQKWDSFVYDRELHLSNICLKMIGVFNSQTKKNGDII